MLRIGNFLHQLTRHLCAVVLALFFVLMFISVVLRQAFSTGSVLLQDGYAYCFAVLVLLAVPVALVGERHVKVDILDNRLTQQSRHRLTQLAYWLFLLPAFSVTLVYALPGMIFSWSILEGSGEVNGLGGYFLVKSVLPLACLLMIFQGFVRLFNKQGPDSPANTGPDP